MLTRSAEPRAKESPASEVAVPEPAADQASASFARFLSGSSHERAVASTAGRDGARVILVAAELGGECAGRPQVDDSSPRRGTLNGWGQSPVRHHPPSQLWVSANVNRSR